MKLVANHKGNKFAYSTTGFGVRVAIHINRLGRNVQQAQRIANVP